MICFIITGTGDLVRPTLVGPAEDKRKTAGKNNTIILSNSEQRRETKLAGLSVCWGGGREVDFVRHSFRRAPKSKNSIAFKLLQNVCAI
jgi:hypothetical protein